MNIDSSEDLFRFEVDQYSFLVALGFLKTSNADVVEFHSQKLTYTIGCQRWGESALSKLEDARNRKKLPPPMTALQYFLADYVDERAKYLEHFRHFTSVRASIAAIAALCAKNPWVFTSTEWAEDGDFLRAIDETQKWFDSASPLPSAPEVLAKLRSFRAK